MAIRVEHELHRRRFGRNLGVGLLLAAFVVLVFALTVVKVKRGDPVLGNDIMGRPAASSAGQGTP